MHTSISFIFFYVYAVVIHLDLDAKSISWFLYHIKIIQINVIPIFIDSWSLTLAKLNSLIKMPSLNMYAVISWPSPKLWFYRLYGCCNQLSIATVLLNAHEWILNRYQSRSPRTLYMYRWSVDSMLMLTVISHNVHICTKYINPRNFRSTTTLHSCIFFLVFLFIVIFIRPGRNIAMKRECKHRNFVLPWSKFLRLKYKVNNFHRVSAIFC